MADQPIESAPSESPAPLHVLHIADAEMFERFGRMFRQLGLAQNDVGLGVSLLTNDAEAAAELDGTPVIDHFYRAFRGLEAWRLPAYLRRQFADPPSLIHLWGTTGIARFSEWAHDAGVPIVIHATNTADVRRLSRRNVHAHEWLLAMCGQDANTLIEARPTAAERIATFAPGILAPAEPRSTYPPERVLGVVWSGVIERGCGLDVLIEAVRRLRARDVELQVALLGRGPLTRAIWRQVRAAGVNHCITLTDGPQLWDHAVPGADIVIVPACQERMALAPLLAMAYGKTVIASSDQVAEWFVEGETALFFTPQSADELTQRIAEVVGRHPTARAIGRSAAEYVARECTITKLAERLAAFYRDVVAAHMAARRETPAAKE